MAHLDGAELTEAMIHAALRRATLDRPGPAGALRVELQVRRRPAAARRGRRLPAQPARPAADRRPSPQEGDRARPQAQPGRAVLRPGLQDHQRRPRRPLVRADLLRQPQGRHPGVQPGQGQEGELLAALSHPRRRPRADRARPGPATSSASSDSRTRSPATPSATPPTRSCSSGSSSPRRSSACRSSRSARPTRGSWPTP